jgi:uncharacterized membrane protein HdeD (DUF308 family)
METVGLIAQIAAALWILNVWILRFDKETDFRGGDATNMREEFDVYGFPSNAVYVVGGLKITLAILLLIGIWIEELVLPAAIGLALLMAGAIAMHVRVGDPPKRALPAVSVLTLSVIAAIFA